MNLKNYNDKSHLFYSLFHITVTPKRLVKVGWCIGDEFKNAVLVKILVNPNT